MSEKEEKKASDGNGEDKELKDKVDDQEAAPGQEQADREKMAREEEEMVKKLQEEIDRLTTTDILVQMLASLSSLAYKKMGIPAGVNDRFKDKQQARLAVDAYDAILKVIENEISASESDNLKSSLSNLQLNFVKSFE